ncbi:MMPL family transporter [Nocardioides KLBMP 9356]|uniref:MMPL family transporter n=1 Tax=Nocardioides potassii TaxID=2911371 RepID=A0ABS9H7Y3_9ACTN|nr:MMPL family transporter [Nocardioides potassii]MCF6376584.1 MMPL family transporter [Nocardioides potassii]
MLDDLGRVLHRGRHWVGGAWLVLVLLGATVGGGVFDLAQTPDPLRESAESAQVAQRLESVDPEGELVVAVLTGTDVFAVDLVDQASRVLHEVRELPGVVEVRDPWTTGAQDLVAPDRLGTVVVVELDPALDRDGAVTTAGQVAETLRRVAMPEVLVGGPLLAEEAFGDQAVRDAARGEGVAVVLLLGVLALTLGGVVAGALPVLTALGAVCAALLALAGLARVTSVSEYAVNVVTLLGLGLGVDYALLLLGRFREERAAAPRSTDLATVLGRTLATAGRTVLVSGLTVATALTGLLLVGDPVLSPMAVGGLVAVGAATLAGLTLAPVLIAWGHARVPAPGAGRFLGGTPSAHSLLARLAGLAQRRPWLVLVGCTALLVVLASPLLGLDLRNSDTRSLPRDSEPRLALAAIDAGFPDETATQVTVLLEAPYTSPETAAAMATLDAMPGVADVMLLDPGPDDSSHILVEPLPDAAGDYDGPQAQDLVRRLRAADLGPAATVGGPTAELVDTRDALAERAPLAVLVVALLTALLLGVLTRSIVVPLKAIVLNLLSLGATLGVVVAVFQWGWGSSLLGFDPWGAIDVTTPLLLFMFAFGLSMDYHVFLVARIREAWDAARSARPPRRRAGEVEPRAINDRAVLTGITASGPVVTLAAVAIVIVFLGFALGELVAVKEIGVGMTVAVLIDVTIVRGLLLPASMTLLGAWNWWLPARWSRD